MTPTDSGVARINRISYQVAIISGLALVVKILWSYYWPTMTGMDIHKHAVGRDFINNWIGPQLAFSGRLSVLFNPLEYHQALKDLFDPSIAFHNWGYPLFMLPALWPLAQLPYFWALSVWTIGLFAVFAWIAVSPLALMQRTQGVLLLLAAPACLINMLGGQNGFLSALLLVGGLLVMDRRPIVAGVLFGMLTFKPHLGLVLAPVLLALGAWRVIAAATLTATALFALAAALFGIDAWFQYVVFASKYQSSLLREYNGFFTYMMVSVAAGLKNIGFSHTLAMVLQFTVAAPALAAACIAVRRVECPLHRVCLVAAATLLVTPYAFNYDMTAVSVVAMWAIMGKLPWLERHRHIVIALWLAPVIVMEPAFNVLSIPQIAMLAVFITAYRHAMQSDLRTC